jgi:DNA-directed DNA polymerase III PolC
LLTNCHTYYSLKYGTLSIEELFIELKKGGHEAFALADINNTSACMYTLKDAAKKGLHAVVGVDFRNPVQRSGGGANQQYIVLAKSNHGFREINEHLSHHVHNHLDFEDKAPHFDEAFVIYPFENFTEPFQLKEYEFIGLRPELIPRFQRSKWVSQLNKIVVLQTATFRNKKDFNAHRLLRSIDSNVLLSQLPIREQGRQAQLYLTQDEIIKLFEDFPRIVQNTLALLESCNVQMDFTTNKNKNPYTNSVSNDFELLRQESFNGIAYRYGVNPPKVVVTRLNKELEMIQQLDFCSYFLINWDMVKYAQRNIFYYVGRGSGANSLVAYLLRITDVDPIELDLYFERFINPFRTSPPDFDIDFSWTDRDDVTKYLFETHGYDKTALVGTYSTFKHNSVFRELGKVFGLPSQEIKRFQSNPRAGLSDYHGKYVVRYADYISGFPSHLSVHASGIIISNEPITSYTGTFMPPKGFATTQFNMHVSEEVGLHKFDILSQRGLGKIKDSIVIVKQNKGIDIDIHDVKKFKTDPKVKNLLKKGEAIGCFYIESPAMRMLLTKLEAEDYLRLVAASSIIRPGVAQSGMMREYILRYQDEARREEARKEIPELYELMEETYGVMVYQEDVIKVAHFFAGLTLAEADVLRRGMSWSFRQRNDFRVVKDKFFNNCIAKGYNNSTISRIWEQIESFANYAFAKGHSASYAIESFQALYLKAYHPLEYMVATLNNGGGFYRTELYLHETRLHGGIIEAPCVNHSHQLTTIRGKIIHLGMVYIHGLERNLVHQLVTEQQKNGPYKSLRHFVKRVPVSLEQTILLIRVGAFRFTGKDKKQLLWDAHFLLGHNKKTKPSIDLFEVEAKEFTLPELWYHELETPFDQMELLGFPLSDPFLLLREPPPSKLLSSDLPSRIGQRVEIAGYLVHRKSTSTKGGDHMSFGVFLDLEGQWLDSVHFPQVANDYPFGGPGCYLITGVVTEEFGFISIEAQKLKRLDNQNIEPVTSKLKPVEKNGSDE